MAHKRHEEHDHDGPQGRRPPPPFAATKIAGASGSLGTHVPTGATGKAGGIDRGTATGKATRSLGWWPPHAPG